jgi:hypothetical protein
MYVYMEHNGVKVRISLVQSFSLDDHETIKKIVELAFKTQSDGKGKTVNQSEDLTGS